MKSKYYDKMTVTALYAVHAQKIEVTAVVVLTHELRGIFFF